MTGIGWLLIRWVTIPLTLFVAAVQLAIRWRAKRGRHSPHSR